MLYLSYHYSLICQLIILIFKNIMIFHNLIAFFSHTNTTMSLFLFIITFPIFSLYYIDTRNRKIFRYFRIFVIKKCIFSILMINPNFHAKKGFLFCVFLLQNGSYCFNRILTLKIRVDQSDLIIISQGLMPERLANIYQFIFFSPPGIVCKLLARRDLCYDNVCNETDILLKA